MKITCNYCGSLFDDTEEKCPHCNGVNPNVQKGNISNPQTIEELKTWYNDRNLPPYSVTRFFIGINTKEAKAFGIYRKGKKVVVYKNKANGERAVRYEGTDEAYAVSELLTRLKQEIINQKLNNEPSTIAGTVSSYGANEKYSENIFKKLISFISDIDWIPIEDPWDIFFQREGLKIAVIAVLFFICFLLVFQIFSNDKWYIVGFLIGLVNCLGGIAAGGYFFLRVLLSWIGNCIHYGLDIFKGLIFVILEGVPALVMVFLGVVSGIFSILLIDYPDNHLRQGYYISQVDRKPFYYTGKWFYYDYSDSQWELYNQYDGPPINELIACDKDKEIGFYDFETVGPAYAGEEYNKSFSFSDFTESVAYSDEINGYRVDTGYYNYNDDIYYHLLDYNNSGWYYYDDISDDWRKTEESEIPDDLTHQIYAEDFWFTPTWDSSTQFYDFEESEAYSEYQAEEAEKAKSSSSSSSYSSDDWDSSYDWDSSDSWDSGSTDWDSDW